MPVSFQKQFSFNTGLVSPRLIGNSNIGKYQNALETSLNFIIGLYGFITARPGFKYIGEVNSSTQKSRLIPFRFSSDTAYILEFANNKIRFFKDSAQILQSRGITNGTFTTNLDGWTQRNAGTGAVAQSAGVASFTSSGAGNEARLYQTIERAGIEQYTVTCDVATNNLTYRVGTSAGDSSIATGTVSVGTSQTFTFTPTTNGTVYIEFEATANATLDNVSVSTPVYSIDSPFSSTENFTIVTAQSFDTIYLAHPDYATRKLVRYGDDNWQLDTVNFVDGPYLEENTSTTTLTPSGTTGSITLTASTNTFVSTDVGRLVRWRSGPDNEDAVLYDNPGSAQVYFDIPFFPQTSSDVEVFRIETTGAKTELSYVASSPGANEFSIANSQVEINTALTSGQTLLVQRKNTGSGEWYYLKITAYTSATQVTATVQGSDLDNTNASTFWRLGAWSETTGYPSKCVFHDQRLWFANNTYSPDGLWASKVQSFENFSPDNDLNKGQVDADSSINATVAGIVTIEWIKATNILLLGGEGIYSVNKTGTAITPSNINVSQEEATLASDLIPVVTANEIVFAEEQKKAVRSVGFTFQSDSFTTFNLNLLTDNVFEQSQIAQLVYQTSPLPLLWARKEDGSIATCTYDKEQDLYAWSNHSLGGTNTEVESLAVIPQGAESQLWAVVKRTINSGTKRYIEVLQPQFYLDTQSDAAYSDSHLVYSGTSTSTISGLDHLEGETVVVQDNGGVQTSKTVSSGSITLDSATTKAIIGLSYTMEGETIPLDTGKPNGPAIGSKSRISSVIIDLFETYGLEIGYSSAKTSELLLRPAGLIGGQAYALFSGQKNVLIPGNTETQYKVYFKNPYPLPCTIRSITYKVDISSN